MKLTHLGLGTVLLCLSAASMPARADDSSYTFGTVWDFEYYRTEPGQFENYIDYLAREGIRKVCEAGKKTGQLLSCHVFSVNNARAGEADIIVATEYKDYLTTAQRKQYQDLVEETLKSGTHKLDKEFGDRKVMRTPMGSVETQELILK